MAFSPRSIVLILANFITAMACSASPAPLPDDPRCTTEDRTFMARAYELARAAIQDHSGYPFGALLVVDGKIVAEYHNCELEMKDPTKHAETGLISAFAPKLGRDVLARATLYASSEPCTMCCGAIRFAGIRKVVYGTTESQFVKVIGERNDPHPLDSREVFARTAPDTVVLGPLMEAEGLAIHEAYWPLLHPGS
ncbi:MAG TPA: nucleoside deaminase [Candidatus Didemnitutus sp.]|jgi:tRNA(Arg) A34 adenosine deaminase TadA